MICTLTDSFDAIAVERIQACLGEVERDHGVRVLWAIGSGNRAWGFLPPDSDYDYRFFHVCRRGDYLSPWHPRDAIETPLDDVLDVSGWDLIRTIRLATYSNATVMEWLCSPLIYRGQPVFAEELLDICRTVMDHGAIRRHCFHVGRAHWNRSGTAKGGRVSPKKLFYAVRPAAVLHQTCTLGSPVPPMSPPALLEEALPAEDVIDTITILVRAKAVTRELGEDVAPGPIRRFMLHELGLAAETGTQRLRSEIRYRASAAFTNLLKRFTPTYA